jgi:hypothetical protein
LKGEREGDLKQKKYEKKYLTQRKKGSKVQCIENKIFDSLKLQMNCKGRE